MITDKITIKLESEDETIIFEKGTANLNLNDYLELFEKVLVATGFELEGKLTIEEK